MWNIVVIGFAGLAGTLARYALSGTVDARFGPAFPVGTLVVNLVGSFVIGFLFFGFANQFAANPTLRSGVFVGLLGGFTTFSSFAIQTFTLWQEGRALWAVGYVLLSNGGGLAGVALGYLSARALQLVA